MKIVVFYRPDSEHERRLQEFLHDLRRTHDIPEKNIQMMNLNTREGAAMASIYDVLSYPGIVVTDDFGAYIKGWEKELPLMQEVASYISM